MTKATTQGARTRARELLLQALYQEQIAGHSKNELSEQFHAQAAWARVDQLLFDEGLAWILDHRSAIEERLSKLIDRPLEQLDPVERAILMIGVFELEARIDVPYRVVINEGVNLARRFGAVDGHKYINACLDVAARSLRAVEVEAQGRG